MCLGTRITTSADIIPRVNKRSKYKKSVIKCTGISAIKTRLRGPLETVEPHMLVCQPGTHLRLQWSHWHGTKNIFKKPSRTFQCPRDTYCMPADDKSCRLKNSASTSRSHYGAPRRQASRVRTEIVHIRDWTWIIDHRPPRIPLPKLMMGLVSGGGGRWLFGHIGCS